MIYSWGGFNTSRGPRRARGTLRENFTGFTTSRSQRNSSMTAPMTTMPQPVRTVPKDS
jgi:hypothetical protein